MPYIKDRSRNLLLRTWGEGFPDAGSGKMYSKLIKLDRVINGNVNPSYKEQIALLQNATTTFTGSYATFDTRRGHVTLKAHTRDGTVHVKHHARGELAAYNMTAPTWVGGWSSRATSKAAYDYLQAVKKTQVKMSGAVFLGELKEVVRMITQPLSALEKGIKEYLRAVKRANRENRRRYFNKKPVEYRRNLAKIAGGLWLEKSFGWDPFLYDIADSRDAYNALFDKHRHVNVSGSGKDMKLLASTVFCGADHPTSTLKTIHSSRTLETEIIRYKGLVEAQAVTTAYDRFTVYGMSLREWVPTAYELCPWSFLLDYFANVGELIEAQFIDTSTVKWTNYTRIRQTSKQTYWSVNRACLSSAWGSWVIDSIDWSPSQAIWARKYVDRAKSTVPSPTLQFYYPRSDKRLLNVAALMAAVGLDTHPQRRSGRTYRL